MKVKDAMHRVTSCVEPGTPVTEIARLMQEADVGAIPVRTDGHLIGIVTDRRCALAQPRFNGGVRC